MPDPRNLAPKTPLHQVRHHLRMAQAALDEAEEAARKSGSETLHEYIKDRNARVYALIETTKSEATNNMHPPEPTPAPPAKPEAKMSQISDGVWEHVAGSRTYTATRRTWASANVWEITTNDISMTSSETRLKDARQAIARHLETDTPHP